uniref:Uncharacterized protein n=1 Tax=Loxodonta africana TaxID=9785 RepID=G3TZF0_LOXAF
ELVSKIQAMPVAERSLVLETISLSLQKDSTLGPDMVDTYIQELLTSVDLGLRQPLRKNFFRVYGLVLRESPGDMLRKHLPSLLELSHQDTVLREGIALAVGIASTSHLEEVWAVLEQMGHTKFQRSSSIVPDSQDNVLKMSFLSAVIMLTKVLRWEYGAQSYKFTQIPELIQCLLCILQKEPNFLATLLRQKIILVILALSTLRPHLKPMVKSKILKTCLQSLYPLPPTEMQEQELVETCCASNKTMLYNKTMTALNLLFQHFISENESMDEIYFLLQHTETWLQSNKSHERKRVVQSIFLLLQHAVEKLNLTVPTTPSMLGHQIGLLTLLWRDKDEDTQYHSQHSVYFLLQLLVQQRGPAAESIYLNKLKSFEAKDHREWEIKLYNLVKALEENLTVAQHTQLVLTLLHGLCSSDHLCSDLASELLFIIFEDPGIKPEQVAEILQGLFQELPAIIFRDVQLAMTKAVTALGTQHTQETVEVILSLSPPTDRQVLTMWKALGINNMLARKVVTVLYVKMRLRPACELVRPNHHTQLVSLLALSTIYELLYMPEYKPTVRWAFAGILLGLLTQLHYLFELGCVEGISDYVEDTLDLQPLSPSRWTCLEALKGLFWTTNYWEVFAYVKLLGGWERFEHQDSYTEGVTLLARAMAHYDCEVRAVLGQAIISLKSPEERDNVVAILIITELLNNRELALYASRKTMDSFLSLGLNNPSQLVRAMSLKGLSSILMHPEKVSLLQSQLSALLDSLLKPEPRDPWGLMQTLGEVLHCLGPQGGGALSLRIAQHLLLLFEDDEGAGGHVGTVTWGLVTAWGGRDIQDNLGRVPVDPRPQVGTRGGCPALPAPPWRSGSLGAGPGHSCCLLPQVESNFGSYHLFLRQASPYLGSPYRTMKLAAMKFMEGMLRDYFTDLCLNLKKDDLTVLWNHLEMLRQDQDSVSRKFYLNFLEDFSELSQRVT